MENDECCVECDVFLTHFICVFVVLVCVVSAGVCVCLLCIFICGSCDEYAQGMHETGVRSPILVEADFTAWWSGEVTIFVSACAVLILKNVLEKKSENNQFLLVFYHTKVCEKKKKNH